MKRIVFIMVVCFLGLHVHSQEQSDSLFSLKVEIKKPTGKLDKKSYALLTVYNHTDEDARLMLGYDGCDFSHTNSFFDLEYIRKNGVHSRGYRGTCFFLDFKKSRYPLIPAHGSYESRIPILWTPRGVSETGLMARSGNNAYAKVRAIVRDFEVGFEREQKIDVYKTTLYSNWLDVSNEDFSVVEGK